MRRVHRPRHTKWIVVLLTLCALMTPAFLFYPNILRAVSPKAYVAYAAARTEAALTRDAGRLRAVWGLPAWESLLREPSYIITGLTLDAAEGARSDMQPIPDSLCWQMEAWRDATAGTLSTRQKLRWGDNAFVMDGWLSSDALTVSVPQLYGKPLLFASDVLGREWNDSFLSEIVQLPDDLSLSVPRIPETEGENLFEVLCDQWREVTPRVTFVSETENMYTFSLPEPDARRLLDAALDSSGMDALRLLPDFAETLDILLDDMDVSGCKAFLFTDDTNSLRVFTLSFLLAGEDSLTLTIELDRLPSPLDELTVEACRISQTGRFRAGFKLTAAGLVRPAEAEQIEADLSLIYYAGLMEHALKLNISLDLTAAPDNLRVTADWDGAHAELTGGYAADTGPARMSVSINSLSLSDDADTITLTGRLQFDWRRASDGAPPRPSPPNFAQPVNTLDRFEQSALLESYYRLFYRD